jgi:hypothetical protein
MNVTHHGRTFRITMEEQLTLLLASLSVLRMLASREAA